MTEVAPGEYRVDAAAGTGHDRRLTAWLAQRDVPLGDLRAGRQRLEDVFLRLTTAATAEPPRQPSDAGRARRGRRSRPSGSRP